MRLRWLCFVKNSLSSSSVFLSCVWLKMSLKHSSPRWHVTSLSCHVTMSQITYFNVKYVYARYHISLSCLPPHLLHGVHRSRHLTDVNGRTSVRGIDELMEKPHQGCVRHVRYAGVHSYGHQVCHGHRGKGLNGYHALRSQQLDHAHSYEAYAPQEGYLELHGAPITVRLSQG